MNHVHALEVIGVDTARDHLQSVLLDDHNNVRDEHGLLGCPQANVCIRSTHIDDSVGRRPDWIAAG